MVGDNMTGFMNLYICNDGKTVMVPKIKRNMNKPIAELSLQEVLHVQIAYETEERYPSRIIGVWFDRLVLDESGRHTENKNHPALQNFINYVLTSAEELSQREEPLAIPAAPIIPTQFEKECLKAYIKNNYQILWNNSPQII